MLSHKEAMRRQEYWEKWFEFVAFVLGSALLWVVVTDAAGRERETAWQRFVQVEGQPEPVPEQWVATPEGRFAHSIRIPNPVPKDSGYRRGMTSEQYFEHLCRTEAGEFIFKTVDGVEGFYFMRPPKRPRDVDLQDRYALEAPEIERTFQLIKASTLERAMVFVAPPFNAYSFIEEAQGSTSNASGFVRASGFRGGVSPMKLETTPKLSSRYAITWRGVRRASDRELLIAGGEWIVLDLDSDRVMAVMRNYGRIGEPQDRRNRIWWLNALSCPWFARKYKFATSEKLYDFVAKVIRPRHMELKGGSNVR